MNEQPQTNAPAPDEQPSLAASLHHQVTFLLLALVVISGTLTSYLFYQSRVLDRELSALEPQARQAVDNYNRNLPRIQKFIREMIVYGQKHPDFQPILKKYGLPLTLPAGTNSLTKPAAPNAVAPEPLAPNAVAPKPGGAKPKQ